MMQVVCQIPGASVATDDLWRMGDYCVEVRAGVGRMGSFPVAPVNCVAFVNFLTSNIAKDKGKDRKLSFAGRNMAEAVLCVKG